MNAAPHRLDPLLRPTSIAVVGESDRAGTVGQQVFANLRAGKYAGTLYAVSPIRETLHGHPCFASLEALPAPPEHVILAVSDARLEAVLDASIDAGVRAVTIMSAMIPDDERSAATANGATLKERVRRKVSDAGILACGGNAMGFFNITDRVWACGFDTRTHSWPGNVALISQSGAGMCGIVDCETRIDFSLAVSTGNELSVGLEDYLDFALEQPETRVVGLFIETSRRPSALRAAFAKARQRSIPVVAIKTGKTESASQLTVSHSGALAGNDAAFSALFDRYGVQRVQDMDELATALILFAQWKNIGALIAMKTTLPGIAHKSDVDGVVLNLNDEQVIRAAWSDLSERLGDEVIIMPMAPAGIETILGMHRDADFGPLIVIGFGGIYAETLKDTSCALPPFDAAHARRLIDGLKLRPLLDDQRGRPACDIDALCDTAARYSQFVCALGASRQEIDINPLIVHAGGCIAADALVVNGQQGADVQDSRRFA